MEKYYLAYFDILGYGKRIESHDLSEEYEINTDFISRARICMKKFVSRADIKDVSHLHFSDTHIFYKKADSEISFGSIIGCALCFMNISAIRQTPYLPVRGCITYGDFIADLEKNIIIGEALRNAYRIEKKQEWCGCCLSHEIIKEVENFLIFREFIKKGILVKYKVPLKNNKIYSTYVINMEAFPRVFGDNSKKMPITQKKFWENIFINRGEENKDLIKLNNSPRKKLKNTQKFFQHIENIKNQFEN